MRSQRSREPGWWNAVGIVGAILGVTFWVLVAVVAWHFIAKYW